MRKFLLTIVGAAAFFGAAAPAAAQYYPAPPPRAFGPEAGWGEVRELQGRINNVRRQIDMLDHRDAIRGRTADRLMDEANKIDRRLRDKSRYGLDPRAAGDIQYRLDRLGQRVHWAVEGHWDRIGDRW